MGKYQTEQKKMLLAFFASNRSRQFTAEEAAEVLLGEDNPKSPGKSTVYRLVAQMAEDGYLRRFAKADGKRGWVYQYHEKNDCQGHLHLKCVQCGALFHLECGMSNELLTHIENMHRFQVDNHKTVLYGLCEHCQEKREEDHA